MARSAETLRRLLASRSVATIFGLQVALFLTVFILPTIGLENIREVAHFDIISGILAKEGILINESIEYLLPPGLKEEDVWLGLLAIPVVYYVTAVVVAIPGRAIYRFAINR